MAEEETLYEARALLTQFQRSTLRSLHVRTAQLEFFASRDAALGFADTIPPVIDASAVQDARTATIDLTAPHVGTIARLAAVGSAVAAGERYGALTVLDEERPLVADHAGTITTHHHAIGDLVEYGTVVVALVA